MILGIGDMHLEAIDGVVPSGLKHQLRTLERVLGLGYKRGAREAVLLGDVFDTATPSQTTMVALADTLSKFNLTYHVLAGNHDRPELNSHSLEVFAWIFKRGALKGRFYAEPELVSIDGSRYWVCPHPYVEDQPPKAVLSFGHYARTGARRPNGSKEAKGHSPAGFWVLGDYHEYQQAKGYIYAGSLTQLDFGETAKKGYLEIDGPDVSFRRIKPSYELRNLPIADAADFKAATVKKDQETGAWLYYKALFQDGYLPPDGWQQKYPRIIRRDFRGPTSDASQKTSTARFLLTTDPLEGLASRLIERAGLSLSERKWAIKKAGNYAKSLLSS